MAESMLAILCHILRGEPVIQERLTKEREGAVRPDEEPAPTAPLGGGSGAPGSSATGGEGSTTTQSSTGAPSGGSTDDSSNSSARREPQVNQAQLTQVF